MAVKYHRPRRNMVDVRDARYFSGELRPSQQFKPVSKQKCGPQYSEKLVDYYIILIQLTIASLSGRAM